MQPVRISILVRVLLGFAVHAYGTSAIDEKISTASLALQDDIKRDTAALIALREEIAEQREPMSERLRALQEEAAELRSEEERMQRLRRQGERDQARLAERAAAARESIAYAQNLLTEYARTIDTRMTAAEVGALESDLKPLRDQLPESDGEVLVGLADQLLGLSSQWSMRRMGGHIVSGTALDDDGIAQEGHFAVWGPLSFFADRETGLAGIAIPRVGRLEPGLHPVRVEQGAALLAVLDGQSARLPVDLTGGDAIRLEESRVHFVDRLRQGGFVMIPLLLTGLVALVLAIWKFVSLWRLQRAVGVDVAPVAALIQQGNIEQARERIASIRAPLADVVHEAIMHRHAPREHLEEILHEHVVNVLPQAERHLGMLAVLGGVAPLLGLLGTVTGMIHTFQLVTLFGSGDARLLSGGISEALVTTETGLIIAVPVLLVQAGLARWARSVVAALERKAMAIVNILYVRGREA